jgi:hypothetical protein
LCGGVAFESPAKPKNQSVAVRWPAGDDIDYTVTRALGEAGEGDRDDAISPWGRLAAGRIEAHASGNQSRK